MPSWMFRSQSEAAETAVEEGAFFSIISKYTDDDDERSAAASTERMPTIKDSPTSPLGFFLGALPQGSEIDEEEEAYVKRALKKALDVQIERKFWEQQFEALGSAMADVLFPPATEHAADAVAALVRCYPMVRAAFASMVMYFDARKLKNAKRKPVTLQYCTKMV